jgi:hypothetical protein
MRSLYYSHDHNNIDAAYIIRIKNNDVSEKYAQRCAESCDRVGMNYVFWDAYDGTGDTIIEPDHSKNNNIMKCIKIMNHFLTKAEIATVLSHASLWAKCLEQDKPLVVLEHDAIMIQKYDFHLVYNSISFLGCKEQITGKFPVNGTAMHGTDGPNLHFICRAHAYAIDPPVARGLISYILKYGITHSADVMMRSDLYSINQTGLYAYDDGSLDTTTIKNRIETTHMRNDELKR